MDQAKLNELMAALKSGNLAKLEEVKGYMTEEEYDKALSLFREYGGKSEAEIIRELARVRNNVSNQQEIIDKIKPFLNDEQKKKLQKVLQMLDGE